MRKILAILLVFLVLAAGIGYLIYPTVSDQLAQKRDAELMKAYREKTAAMDTTKTADMLAEAKAYNEALEGIRITDEMTSGRARTDRDYQNRLNVHAGVIGQLVIPKAGICLPVRHLSTETPATSELVHLDGSSLPAGEPGENVVLAGPSVVKPDNVLGDIGLTNRRVLEGLDGLTPGDLMILNVLDRTMVYRVDAVQTVSRAGLNEMDFTPQADEERLTVISVKPDRELLVQASRIPIAQAREMLQEEDSTVFPENWKNVLLLGSPVFLLGLIVLWIIERIKRQSYRLPDEGRQTARREKRTKEKLAELTTDAEKVEDHEQKDSEGSEPADSPGDAAGEHSVPGVK